MRASEQRPRVIDLLHSRGLVRAKDFTAAGITRTTLKRLCDEGVVMRVTRGLYRSPAATMSENASLAEVQVRIPACAICLLSALRFHGMTTQNPAAVWIAIERKARKPRASSPLLEVVRFSPRLLHSGIEIHPIDGVPVRITSAARTVADCFHYRNKIGTDVAVEALRDYLRSRRGTIDDLLANARLVGAANVMRPYLEALM
jgi:predicted transcriptional regulator of viral defense system